MGKETGSGRWKLWIGRQQRPPQKETSVCLNAAREGHSREANPLTQELEWRHLGRRRETARGGAELVGPKGVYKEPGFSEGLPPTGQRVPQAMWGSPRSRVPLAATWRIDCRQQGRSGAVGGWGGCWRREEPDGG